ncbi:MAG: hypothetical protein KOO62_05355 [candidate division Zixibacteria bacterium]|nr:hypothetical protein [candidate division Zixibacteria bacterium]
MKSKKAAILLSRQPLHPNGNAGWVRQVIKAVQWVRDHDLTLVTSIGLQTWELITTFGAELDLRQEILIPAANESDFARLQSWTLEQFTFDQTRTRIRPVILSEGGEVTNLSVQRDRAVVDTADTLVPISVRSGGNMSRLISEGYSAGKEIMSSMQIVYQRRSSRLKYKIIHDHLNSELDRFGRKYLVHWTRSSNGPWPDERVVDYWRAVVDSKTHPRSAFDTLQHIVSTRKIIASPRHMPGGVATVSMTGLDPEKALALMRWRARYHEMSFEPYGLAIDRDFALAHGVVPVVYYEKKSSQSEARENAWQFQSRGHKTDWRVEEEFRCRGDFDLSGIPPDKLLAICYRPDESTRLESTSGIRTISILAR